MSWSDTAFAALYLPVGVALGAAHFALLWLMVRRSVLPPSTFDLLLPHLLRLVLVATAFWFIAQQGAAPVAFALLGFLIARAGVRHYVGPS